MTFHEIKDNYIPYATAISLNRIVSKRYRTFLRHFVLLVAFAAFAASFIDLASTRYNTLPDGIFFILLTVFIILLFIEAFYNSSRFTNSSKIDFAVAQIVGETHDHDVTEGFCRSPLARALFLRLGISITEVERFITSERAKVATEDLAVDAARVNFASYAGAVYKVDPALAHFLSLREIGEPHFVGAAEWVQATHERVAAREKWWSHEALSKIPSIGTELSFGMTPELSKYGRFVERNFHSYIVDIENGYRAKELSQIDNALLQSDEANAIVVDNDSGVVSDIVLRFAKKLREGKVPAGLEHRHVVEFDWPALLASSESGAVMERELIKILNDCMRAGNVILYIANLPSFLTESVKKSVNAKSLLEEYLVSPKIHIIAHSTKTDFYYFVESNPHLAQMFERVVPDEKGPNSSLPPLLEKAISIEMSHRGNVVFTYPAIVEIAELADNYLSIGEMPGKALDLMTEFSAWVAKNGIGLVMKNHVADYMARKTGIAMGNVSADEGRKLARLEEILHERIVGQDEAVRAVSAAMRRSRSGVGNPKRPIASFLFLGPTGVGKTETAKALAESFFGSEDRMVRFDMSEYNGPDASPRLIGSFSEEKIGDLSRKLRDNPYSVVLLDEFEKAAPDVQNLFLRILDEGKFTDAFEGEVNARNSIIIATSNAGAEFVWQLLKNGEQIDSKKSEIIDWLVENHIFKPEFLNRFDGIIVFQPLEDKELRNVADKIFEKFARRLQEEKQIMLRLSPELLDYLVLHGASREFGARSMSRIIQEKIEDLVARKILSREIKPGATVEFGLKDVMSRQ